MDNGVQHNRSAAGLTSNEAREQLARFGENRIRRERRAGALTLFLAQFKSPIVLILIGAAIISFFLQDHTDASLILSIVLVSGLLGFWQERGATRAVAKLRAMVETKVRVLRDGRETLVPLAEVVPGDIALLSAGAIVPVMAGSLSRASFSLTRPSSPEKHFQLRKRHILSIQPLRQRQELFLGTHVVSGWAKPRLFVPDEKLDLEKSRKVCDCAGRKRNSNVACAVSVICYPK